jgi:hypothetical protein
VAPVCFEVLVVQKLAAEKVLRSLSEVVLKVQYAVFISVLKLFWLDKLMNIASLLGSVLPLGKCVAQPVPSIARSVFEGIRGV